jgi:hypothetical protein
MQDELARQEAYPNLPQPYRIQALVGKKIKFVASGAAAAHIICIDMEGKLMAWGRNEVSVSIPEPLGLTSLCSQSGMLAVLQSSWRQPFPSDPHQYTLEETMPLTNMF